ALARGRPGLVIGPRMFITVGMPSPLRASAAYRIEGWNTWANRNVIPTRPTSSSTAGTGRSSLTPSASSTSAEPDFEEEARLPCLTTVRPVEAMMIEAIVEMFTVWARSPPGRPDRAGVGDHRVGQRRRLRARHAFRLQRDQEPGQLHRGRLPGHRLVHGPGGRRAVELLAAHQARRDL